MKNLKNLLCFSILLGINFIMQAPFDGEGGYQLHLNDTSKNPGVGFGQDFVDTKGLDEKQYQDVEAMHSPWTIQEAKILRDRYLQQNKQQNLSEKTISQAHLELDSDDDVLQIGDTASEADELAEEQKKAIQEKIEKLFKYSRFPDKIRQEFEAEIEGVVQNIQKISVMPDDNLIISEIINNKTLANLLANNTELQHALSESSVEHKDDSYDFGSFKRVWNRLDLRQQAFIVAFSPLIVTTIVFYIYQIVKAALLVSQK